MEDLTSLLEKLQARHSEFFSRCWDSLSVNDAKMFTQIERDIMAVQAALGSRDSSPLPDFRALLERLNQTMSELEQGSLTSRLAESSILRSETATHEARLT